MPDVRGPGGEKMKFPYTQEGVTEAKQYAKKTGKKMKMKKKSRGK